MWPFHDREGRQEGYEARHAYAIGCADLAEAGEMLGELAREVGDGLAIDSVGLEVTEDHGAGGKAREAAFHDARERAAALARMAGAGLGAVQSIVEGDAGTGPVADAQDGDDARLRWRARARGGVGDLLGHRRVGAGLTLTPGRRPRPPAPR